MSRKWIAYGILGIACGLGQAAERGSPQEISISASEEREACLRRSLAGAVDIYALRSLGRGEAGVIGVKLDRAAGEVNTEGRRSEAAPSRPDIIDPHALRHPGRAEAHEVRVPGYVPVEMDRHTLRDGLREGRELRIYDLRRQGREEARVIADPCALDPRRPA